VGGGGEGGEKEFRIEAINLEGSQHIQAEHVKRRQEGKKSSAKTKKEEVGVLTGTLHVEGRFPGSIARNRREQLGLSLGKGGRGRVKTKRVRKREQEEKIITKP